MSDTTYVSLRKEKADGISAQIEKLLEFEYQRGWDSAMEYVQKEVKSTAPQFQPLTFSSNASTKV